MGIVTQTVSILIAGQSQLSHGEVKICIAVHLDPQSVHNRVPVFGIQRFHLYIADELHVGAFNLVRHTGRGHVPVTFFIDQNRIKVAACRGSKVLRSVCFRNRFRPRGIKNRTADGNRKILRQGLSYYLTCPVGVLDVLVPVCTSKILKALRFRVVRESNGSVIDIHSLPAGNHQCFQGNGNLIPDTEALSGSKASQVNRKAFPVLVEIRCQGFGRSRGARLEVIQERTLHILDIRQYRFRGGIGRIIEGIRNPDIFQGKLVAAVCLPGNRIGDGIASVLIANRIGRGFVQNESCFGLQVRAGAVFRVLGCKSIRLIGYQLAFTVLNKGIAVFELDPVA